VIYAYAVEVPKHPPALFLDRPRAEQYAAKFHGIVVELQRIDASPRPTEP